MRFIFSLKIVFEIMLLLLNVKKVSPTHPQCRDECHIEKLFLLYEKRELDVNASETGNLLIQIRTKVYQIFPQEQCLMDEGRVKRTWVRQGGSITLGEIAARALTRQP